MTSNPQLWTLSSLESPRLRRGLRRAGPLLFGALFLSLSPAQATSLPKVPSALESPLKGLIPAGKQGEEERDLAKLAEKLYQTYPNHSSHQIHRLFAWLGSRTDRLDRSLRKARDHARTGPTLKALEVLSLHFLEAGRWARAQSEAWRSLEEDLDPQLGSGRLRTVLALEEMLRLSKAQASNLSRTLDQLRGSFAHSRRLLLEARTWVHQLEDRNPRSQRGQVLLSRSPGLSNKVQRMVQNLGQRLERAQDSVRRVEELARVRRLGLSESLRNLSREFQAPRTGLREAGSSLQKLQDQSAKIQQSLEKAARDLSRITAGDPMLPELPKLPRWLFSEIPEVRRELRQGSSASAASPREVRLDDDALSLLEELEAGFEPETSLAEDALTESLAESFRERHQLEWSPPEGEAEAAAGSDLLTEILRAQVLGPPAPGDEPGDEPGHEQAPPRPEVEPPTVQILDGMEFLVEEGP